MRIFLTDFASGLDVRVFDRRNIKFYSREINKLLASNTTVHWDLVLVIYIYKYIFMYVFFNII